MLERIGRWTIEKAFQIGLTVCLWPESAVACAVHGVLFVHPLDSIRAVSHF